MYQTQGPWAATLQSNHQAVVLAVATDASGGILAVLPVIDGHVKADGTLTTRRTCSITVSAADPTLVPISATSALTPFGNRLFLYRGVTYSSASTWPSNITVNVGALYQPSYYELVPIGVYEITTVTVEDTGRDFLITVEGSDRSFAISQHKLLAPYVISAGTLVSTVVRNLCQRQNNLVLNLGQSTYTVAAQTLKEGSDPWAEAARIALEAGFLLYADVNGVINMQPMPTFSANQATVGSFTEGTGGMLVKANRKFTRIGVYNDIIVSGENTGLTTPLRGQAQDQNPNSATYIGGNYGDVVAFYRQTTPTTQAQVDAAAANLLLQNKWASDQLTIDAIPNPALDVYDAVSVTRARLGVNGAYIVDAISLPLRYDAAMTVSLRRLN